MPKITLVCLIKEEELNRELEPFYGDKRIAEQVLKQLILRSVEGMIQAEDLEIHIED